MSSPYNAVKPSFRLNTINNRYAYSLIDVCRIIAEHCSGTREGYTDNEIDSLARWLEKRLESWEESTFPRMKEYDSSVKKLAETALRLRKGR